MIDTRVARTTIARSPWTALVVSFDGALAEVVPFADEPSPEAVLEFTRQTSRGRPFRFMQQADLSEADLNRIVSEIRAPETQATRPGPGLNLPEPESPFQSLRPARSIAGALVDWLTRYWR
jgi:hypothetical protein